MLSFVVSTADTETDAAAGKDVDGRMLEILATLVMDIWLFVVSSVGIWILLPACVVIVGVGIGGGGTVLSFNP
eukprot:2573452-Ditylum_brightwellii.AAC.1